MAYNIKDMVYLLVTTSGKSINCLLDINCSKTLCPMQLDSTYCIS